MKLQAALVATALLAVAAAGCLAPASEDATPATGVPDAALPAAVPEVSAEVVYDTLKRFTTAHPSRLGGNEAHQKARDFLASEMEAAGLEVVRQEFDTPRGFPYPLGPMNSTGVNIIGIKWGTDRDRWVVVGSHYDVTGAAVYGAYDDGSGTVMTLELAKAFAKVETTRTLAFIPFDLEERGLLGSRHFVQSIQDGSFVYPNVTVEAMIDLDMIGINWPAGPAIVAWQNSPELKALNEELRIAEGVPDTHMKYRKPRFGSSDGAAFIAAGIPTIYYWSNWDETRVAGQDVPWAYPFWHQADTVEGMDALAGGHDKLLQGMQVDLDIVAGVVHRLGTDPAFRPTSDGSK